MKDIQLRTVGDSDYEGLAEFLTHGFPDIPPETWQLRFRMWWFDNPMRTPAIQDGWILEKDKQIIGFIGNIPVKYLVDGKEGVAVAATSWFIEPKYRGVLSFRLLSEFNNQKNVDLFLQTTPNQDVQFLLPRYQYIREYMPFNNLEYIKIVNFPKSFYLLLKFILLKKNALFLSKGSFLKELLGGLLQMSHTRRRDGSNLKFQCTICSSCDDSFQIFWEKEREKFSTTLFRDKVTLNWLFFSKAVAGKRIVVKCTSFDTRTLLGYMVFDIEMPLHSKIKIIQLKDVCIGEEMDEVLQELLMFIFKFAHREGISSVFLWSSNEEMNAFLQKKFHITIQSPFAYFYRVNDQ